MPNKCSGMLGDSFSAVSALLVALIGAGASAAVVLRGGNWSVKSPPALGSEEDGLVDVSCASSTLCMAVGFSVVNSDGDTVTLAVLWNGRGWSLQNNPDAGASDRLFAVSCESSASCTTVGSYYNQIGTERPLVERWQPGRWSFELPAHPAKATDGRLVAPPVTLQPMALAGNAVTIIDHIQLLLDRPYGFVSASPAGVLAYVPEVPTDIHQLAWFDRAGRQLGTVRTS